MDARDSTLGISWHDSACIPNLNPSNIMDYFSERSNPFYDRTCNNEIVKMQRLSPDQLTNMTGLEYILLHCQEPILYVVRKQHRHSATEATPLTDYYIIAGVVYQAPDLGSVINSRILSAVHHIQGAFDKTQSFSRYQPSKGYCWDFKEQESVETKKKAKDKGKEEPSSVFQRQRVDMLLVELTKKYPPKVTAAPALTATAAAEKPALPQGDDQSAKSLQQNPQQLQLVEPKVEIKQEKTGDGTSSSAVSVTTPSQAGAGGNNNSNKSSSSSIKPPVEKRPRLMA